MRAISNVVLVVLLCLLASADSWAQGFDPTQWVAVRGDQSPGYRYSAFVESSSGRYVAVGEGGAIMSSDDDGATWQYSTVEQDGGKFFGDIRDIKLVGSSIVAVATSLVPSNNVYGLPFEARTTLLTSNDQGQSWTVTPFPFTEAFAGRDYEGLALTGLHVAPDGSLLAYGTTQLSSGVVTWSIGGAVFRRSGGWNQATFQRGRLSSMATANGRLVAAGFQTILDSADGGGWNGYSFLAADFQAGGPLPFDIVRRLDASQITYQGGQYVMQAQTYVPLEQYPRIFTATIDHTYTFRSANPFDGARLWNGTEHDRVYPNLLARNGGLLSVARGAYVSDTGGQSWTLADDSVQLSTRSLGPVGTNGVIAIGSSEEVWRSDDSGANWEKILDIDQANELSIETAIEDVVYATSGSRIFRSLDNGINWDELFDTRDLTGSFSAPHFVGSNGGQIVAIRSDTLLLSGDEGESWIARLTPDRQTLGRLIVGHDERLILAVPETGPFANSMFIHTSDDNGESWETTSFDTDVRTVRGDSGGFQSGVRAGSSRIVYIAEGPGEAAGIRIFGPRLLISDDNGATWRAESPFENLDDLEYFGDFPTLKTSSLEQIVRSSTGRLLIRGDDEILTSDDQGDTWQVRVNLDLRNFRGEVPNLLWSITDLVQAGSRWIAVGRRGTGAPDFDTVPFALISEDDGSTWREVIIRTRQVNTFVEDLVLGLNGRIIASGGDDMLILDTDSSPSVEPPPLRVREGEMLSLQVPRPPLPGNVELAYDASTIDADEVDDFVPVQGSLVWLEGDQSTREVMVPTVDDDAREDPEEFTLELYGEGDVVVSTSYRIVIDDDDGTGRPGLDVIGGENLVVSEDGNQATVRFALLDQPTANVVVSLTNLDPDEFTLSRDQLEFSPSDWKTAQGVTIVGQDDPEADLNVTGFIRIEVASDDANYDELQLPDIGVVNIDNDQPIFADAFEA